jgi:hypothetical protein
MENFLGTVKTEMVIFCDQECVQELTSLRHAAGDEAVARTTIIAKPLHHMKCAQEPYKSYWQRDLQRDHESRYHNTNLYVVWNEKSNMVSEAIELNLYDTEFYCWCDIGCFRTREPEDDLKRLATFPDPDRLSTAVRDRMYLLSIQPFTDAERDMFKTSTPTTPTLIDSNPFEYTSRIGGTIFIGHKDVWAKWVRAYYGMIDAFMASNLFTGKDQSVMAAVALTYPDLVELVKPVRGEGDPWFYLQRRFTP